MEEVTIKKCIVFVIDSTVAIKWFIEEEYSSDARLLLNAYAEKRIDVAVPNIFYYEVLNTLRNSKAYSEEELKKIMEILDDLQFDRHELTGGYALKTIEYSMRKNLSIYEAAYVALADVLATTLYTADPVFVDKVDDYRLVKHVSEFKNELI